MTAQVAFCWGQFGPYHMDRCRAVAEALGDASAVLGIEIADRSPYYAWAPQPAGPHFVKETLFPGQDYLETGRLARFLRLVRRLLGSGVRHVFLCHADQPEYFAAAIILRLAGRRVHVMTDSKFDDLPRRAWREALKPVFYRPYCGALVGGPRSRAYLRFLGRPRGPIVLGYDTVSIARIRALAGVPPAPDGPPHGVRHFTVIARFVPKKNLGLMLEAYQRYRSLDPAPRDLVLCGSGPEEDALRRQASGIPGVRFPGFLQAEGIARLLGESLALVLPSIEEQWGLVVNEALALGVPVLVAENTGARDLLVRDEVNGHVFEPDNAEGLARLMARIAGDATHWHRLAAATRSYAEAGDVARFAEGVLSLTGLPPATGRIGTPFAKEDGRESG